MYTTEQKLLSAIAHLGTFVGIPILAPIIILIVSKDLFVKQQAKEALCFQITLFLGSAIGALLTFILIGIPILLVVVIAGLILPIVAVVKIVEGECYSYPFTGRFVSKYF
ncbi:DUF4870 domain-containing protein [Thermohalobacter berrensis]|uniref:Orotate phosphoribosyltransferase n=1 Tax=Thermohalobacter berrensis TaxID=99594 RepID=A0A419TB02_9FIRM|nr:DUF4870 domain-containing protein [Thermohalobacter berrensis]RKD34627.1 hypothetical protein BET03_02030 [Thermohalobacter berrensis]